jgi:hypothetical protein
MKKMVETQFRGLRNDLTAMIAGEVAMILARVQAPTAPPVYRERADL